MNRTIIDGLIASLSIIKSTVIRTVGMPAVLIASVIFLTACGGASSSQNSSTKLLAASDSSPPTVAQWTMCANENGRCIFTGTQTVRYGAGSTFVTKSMAWGATCDNNTFGDPVPGVAKHCEVTSSWSFCANENGQCGLSDTETVRYGSGSTFVTQTLTGGAACNNNTFGDPIPGVVKHCDVAPTTWTFCANENGQCNFSGTKSVLYGANGSFKVRTFTNGMACNNSTFGSDPISGVVKSCYIPGDAIPSSSGTGPAGWTMVWSDEFNGASLDTSKWNIEVAGHGYGNNELEYYTNRPQNISVSGGNLVITALQETYTGPDGTRQYTSGRINSSGKFSQAYGRMEARMKLPVGQGVWPAFWMLGANLGSVGWPTCGEIDIMEHINTESVTHGTIHWADVNGNHAQYSLASGNVDVTQWHVYAVEWDANDIKWFVDGTQFMDANIANNINNTGAFHNPFFMILNLAVGGDWPGAPNGTVAFPQQMLVDYVHVYTK